MTTLRPYQRDAIDSVLNYWQSGGGNPLVEMATGTGKSIVIAKLVRELMANYSDMRVLMLVHVKELVAQNFQAMLRVWPQAPIGINAAGLNRRDTHHPILFASIQSVFRNAKRLGPRDLVIVDEAHLVPRDGDGMYQKLLGELDAPHGMRVVGFTATPYRMDSGRLDRGDKRLFEKIVYSYDIASGIDDGFLSNLTSKATATSIDVSGVARRGGEFVPGALEIAVDKDWITRGAVDEIIKYGEQRRSWLVFCTGVKHAHHVRDEIRSRGISCEAVTGDTPSGDRDRILRDFKEGRIRCLTNAMVLTTGFDAPRVDLIAMLRPTLSTGLYVQIVGRGTRLADGKTDCLVLDFAGNVKRHGPVDAVSIREERKAAGKSEDSEVRAKECPACKTLVALNARSCPSCGHEWPLREEPKHEAVADASTSIVSRGAPSWIEVDNVAYYRHEKAGSPPSLRVEYVCGFIVHREWICFEHTGFARMKAEKWWREKSSVPIPATVDGALQIVNQLPHPSHIQIRPSGKYFEVVGKKFNERAS